MSGLLARFLCSHHLVSEGHTHTFTVHDCDLSQWSTQLSKHYKGIGKGVLKLIMGGVM